MRLVRGEGEHDKISVEAVQNVDKVGVVVGLGPLEADVGHDLVLALAWEGRVTEDYADIPPRWVG